MISIRPIHQFLIVRASTVLCFMVFIGHHAISQCGDLATVSTNGKCTTLTWDTTPNSYPQTITLDGDYYTIVATNNPAEYVKDGTNGNGCNNYNNHNGEIEISSAMCTYSDGVLTNESPLPVSLESFGSQILSDIIRLNWVTVSELNNDGFSVEKSINGNDWNEIGWVDGAGTTTERQVYFFLDGNPVAGSNYYRLRQIDFDGAISLSKIISQNFATQSDQTVSIYPNPVRDKLVVNISENKEIQDIEIFNQFGQKIGNYYWDGNSLNVSTLEKGMYFLMLIVDNQKIIERFIVE